MRGPRVFVGISGAAFAALRDVVSPEARPVAPPPGQEGKGPTVIDMPVGEYADFAGTLAPRIALAMASGWATSSARTVFGKWPVELDDRAVLDLHIDTVFSRFVSTTLDPIDQRVFGRFVDRGASGDRWFKIDFSAIQKLRAKTGMYVAPVVALGSIGVDGRRRLVAMRISGMTLEPADTGAWALARWFLLQGAGLHGVLVHHLPLHFQFDAIAAVTSSLLPPDHRIRQLLRPHFRFILPLNKAALHSPVSILTNHPLLPFATFPCDRESVHRLQSTGWSGLEGNSAYPPFRFTCRPKPVFGDLGVFLGLYYDVVLDFVKRALAGVRVDAVVRAWAAEIARWVPGFPNAEGIAAPATLAEGIAACIWGASVVHSTEHHGLAYDVPVGAIPLRLRVPPPFTRHAAAVDPRSLTTRVDEFRQRVAWEVLIRARPVTRLDRIDYGFDEPSLRRANDDFRAALRACDARLPVRRYAPLEKMAQGIQF